MSHAITIPAFLLALALAVLYLLSAVKRIVKDERLIIFKKGKPIAALGPGVVVVWPIIQRSKKVDLSTHSLPLPKVMFLRIASCPLVEGRFTFRIHDPLKAVTVTNVEKLVEQALESVLSSTLSSATIHQCLVETPGMERLVMELVNKRSKGWGVRVTALTLGEFPIHRKMISQLAGMTSTTVVDLVTVMGQVAQMQGANPEPGLKNDAATQEHGLDYKFGINV